jgi:hypothetical protein
VACYLLRTLVPAAEVNRFEPERQFFGLARRQVATVCPAFFVRRSDLRPGRRNRRQIWSSSRGLFLAFPAIFPASATLLENEQKEKKEKVGLHGTIRGRKVAGVDAVGASMGAIALGVFAAIVWKLLPNHSAGLVLLGATIIWFAVSVAIWRTRSLMLHSFNRRKTQRER